VHKDTKSKMKRPKKNKRGQIKKKGGVGWGKIEEKWRRKGFRELKWKDQKTGLS